MATRPRHSEAATLETYRVALDNAEAQPQIATIMADLGYDSSLIGEGKTLPATTRSAYDLNKTEDDETSAAYADFQLKQTDLHDLYSLHRKKAKVIFRNDPVTAEQLGITGSLPKAYVKWLETVKKFYSVATTDTALQSKLGRLKISAEELEAAQTKISELETARTVYLREKGESQEATQSKDAAFAKLDDWMSEFYAVARIGLEDKPQLLEALGKTVRG